MPFLFIGVKLNLSYTFSGYPVNIISSIVLNLDKSSSVAIIGVFGMGIKKGKSPVFVFNS